MNSFRSNVIHTKKQDFEPSAEKLLGRTDHFYRIAVAWFVNMRGNRSAAVWGDPESSPTVRELRI